MAGASMSGLSIAIKALEFYANPKTWENEGVDIGVGEEKIPDSSSAMNDGGETAVNALESIKAAAADEQQPISMILPCPVCALLHIDRPEPAIGWDNPPHKSHLCRSCRCIWRPADVATVGVGAANIKTRGEKDTWP